MKTIKILHVMTLALLIQVSLQPLLKSDVTGILIVKESENLPAICIPFRSALSSPTHVFVETADGQSKQFLRRSVLHLFRLTLPNPAESPNFTNPGHLQPLREYLDQILPVAEAAPCARVFFQPLQKSLQEVINRYERGERCLNGRWMSLAEYQQKLKYDLESAGRVELRLKNGRTISWPRVQIQGQRLVYVSDIGVHAVHRDELVDEQKFLYFPETRPKETASAEATHSPSMSFTAPTPQPTANNLSSAQADVSKYREGVVRFFRLRDGTTHIGRVIVSDDESVVIFTSTARTYRIRKSDILVGLDEQLSVSVQ